MAEDVYLRVSFEEELSFLVQAEFEVIDLTVFVVYVIQVFTEVPAVINTENEVVFFD